MDNLWNSLSQFVKDVCEGRDESHGHLHMESVAKNSLVIYSAYKNEYPEIEKDVIVVAWLHDVEDHKYDATPETRTKIINFLKSIYNTYENVEWILDIIDYISFSKEKKSRVSGVNEDMEPLIWRERLGNKGVVIRNIVSDADKLEALGTIGLKRCIEFIKHKNPNFTNKEVIEAVKKHADEKLLRLISDKYIRTPIGIKLAQGLEDELRTGIDHLV